MHAGWGPCMSPNRPVQVLLILPVYSHCADTNAIACFARSLMCLS